MKNKNLFLGIDCSTQSLTATVIDAEAAKTAFSFSLNFERDFPQYGTRAGAVFSPDNPLEVRSNPAMWLDALDAAMKNVSENVDAERIAAVSNSGQQHASVWLKTPDAFSRINPAVSLSENFKDAFSFSMSPIWMDASSSRECAQMTEAAGGARRVLEITGSVATERFTGPQIRKFFLSKPDVYAATGRIHLNSSFIASVLSGKDAPVDFGDGFGMNLADINRFSWSETMFEACAPGLAGKLPELAPADTRIGTMSEYFCKKYGFSKNAAVVAGTGDNPSSLVGVGAMLARCAAVSLGTSDTYFAPADAPKPAENAHIFANPSGGFMNLICFRNGSLAREKVRDMLGVSWDFFDREAFEHRLPQNDGIFALPFFTDEISPKIKSSDIRFFGAKREDLSKAQIVAAAVEGQIMNMFLEAKKMSDEPVEKIILTGGAAKSDALAQTIADVFGARVGRLGGPGNSASLGAAMRAAKNAGNFSWNELAEKFCAPVQFNNPRPAANKIFEEKIGAFAEIVRRISKGR